MPDADEITLMLKTLIRPAHFSAPRARSLIIKLGELYASGERLWLAQCVVICRDSGIAIPPWAVKALATAFSHYLKGHIAGKDLAVELFRTSPGKGRHSDPVEAAADRRRDEHAYIAVEVGRRVSKMWKIWFKKAAEGLSYRAKAKTPSTLDAIALAQEVLKARTGAAPPRSTLLAAHARHRKRMETHHPTRARRRKRMKTHSLTRAAVMITIISGELLDAKIRDVLKPASPAF